jgi:hypothetical protein
MATTLNIIPTLGTKGLWTARAPFAALLLNNVIYTCVELRSLSGLTASGVDPQATYYTPVGLTSQDYQADVATGAVIISLSAEDGSMVYLPSTYLAAYPDGNGVGYRVMGILVRLTALPDSLSLDALTEKIQSDCLNMIGVNAEVETVALSNLQLINATDNANLEQARRSNITDNTTDFAELQAMTAQRDTYMQRCVLLQEELLKYLTAESTGEIEQEFPGWQSS